MNRNILILSILCSYQLLPIASVNNHAKTSSSSNWNLSEEERNFIRKEGYCMKICGVGYDSKYDGFDTLMYHYHKTKVDGTFDDLDSEIKDGTNVALDNISEIGPILRKEALEQESHSASLVKKVFHVVDVYCKYSNINDDECMDLQRSLIAEAQSESCYRKCLGSISRNIDIEDLPEFDDIPPIKQEFERCLDEFNGPHEFFDYQNKSSININDMLKVLKRNGFVVIQNFFSSELMKEVNDVMNTWDETDIWNNFTYSDFYSTDGDQLNMYRNRLEIVLPFVDPFETVLSTIHTSILMELMSAYGSHQPINIDFPASIMSRPGSLDQSIHGDHGYVAGMLKLNVAIHDIPEESGPTSFCPCTHLNGVFHDIYAHDCRIRYHPKLVKAGTVTIYDQSMMHNGMANNGELKRRYILDLSYNIGNVRNNYTNTYPDLASEHIQKYREAYQNLNLVFN